MPSIRIQFHALHEELFYFVKEIVADFGFHVVERKPGAFAIEVLSDSQLEKRFSDRGRISLHFSRSAPVLGATQHGFLPSVLFSAYSASSAVKLFDPTFGTLAA
jgi:hypothetical protein